jgi:hypothetical protein
VRTSTTFIAASPDNAYIANQSDNQTASEIMGGNAPSIDLRVLAERASTGVWFDLLAGKFGRQFTDQIATEVIVVSLTAGRSVHLAAGSETDVTFTLETGGLPAGTYTATVSTRNSTATTSIVINNTTDSSHETKLDAP